MNALKTCFTIIVLFVACNMNAQNNDTMLPYYEIPDHPETFTSGAVVARMIDGLGFRFYWATEGLTDTDLAYQPSEDSRSTYQTIEHIYALSNTIRNAALNKENHSTGTMDLDFETIRRQTLMNLKTAADILRDANDLSKHNLIFSNREMPFWFNINGPISDAIWHSGQIASFRRASGNPISNQVNHFTGKVRAQN